MLQKVVQLSAFSHSFFFPRARSVSFSFFFCSFYSFFTENAKKGGKWQTKEKMRMREKRELERRRKFKTQLSHIAENGMGTRRSKMGLVEQSPTTWDDMRPSLESESRDGAVEEEPLKPFPCRNSGSNRQILSPGNSYRKG